MSFIKFLYFTKSEKVAISALLSLIVILGAAYIVTYNDGTNGKIDDYMHDSDFLAFEASLQDMESTTIVNKPKQGNESKHFSSSYTKQVKFGIGETLEVNGADTTQLKMIPGIGIGFANRIVKYRDLLGGYNSVNQLKEVWGIDDYLFHKISPYITLKSSCKRIDVNRASFLELNRHPYINYKQATVIVDIRDRKGPIESIDRLALLDEFSQKDIARLRPYLSFL